LTVKLLLFTPWMPRALRYNNHDIDFVAEPWFRRDLFVDRTQSSHEFR